MPGTDTVRVPPRLLADHLLARGQHAIGAREAAALMGLSAKAGAEAMARLRRAGLVFSPCRGLYVAIPPEFRTWGCVPALDFIDPMMKASERHYYVSLLSAAEIHGAAHQRPQVFQVMVDKQLANRQFGRVRLRFYTRQCIERVPVVLVNSRANQVRVSSPAATLLDVAARPGEAGGLSNAATVIHDLVEAQHVSAEDLLHAAESFPASGLRRAGYLLELVGAEIDLESLVSAVALGRPDRTRVLLDPRGPKKGHLDGRWGIVINGEVDPDL